MAKQGVFTGYPLGAADERNNKGSASVLIRGLLLIAIGVGLAAYLLLYPIGPAAEQHHVTVLPTTTLAFEPLVQVAPGAAPPTVTQPIVIADDPRDSYCLWPDDTLSDIAAAAGVTADAILAENPDYTGYAGSAIYLPPGSTPPHLWTTPPPAVPAIEALPFGVSGYYISYNNRDKQVALSFDIGYVPENHELMRWLADEQIRATFLVMGDPVSRYPDVVHQVLANGHELGNHSFTHANMLYHQPDDVRAELRMTENAVQAADPNATTKPLFRAPFGAINPPMVQIAREEGFYVVGWTIDSRDWNEGITAQQIYNHVTHSICPGAIIALHDVNPASKVALPSIIDFLRRKGYTFATLSELIFPPVTGG